jgi:hypothetical protein
MTIKLSAQKNNKNVGAIDKLNSDVRLNYPIKKNSSSIYTKSNLSTLFLSLQKNKIIYLSPQSLLGECPSLVEKDIKDAHAHACFSANGTINKKPLLIVIVANIQAW